MQAPFSLDPLQAEIEVAWRLQCISTCQGDTHTDDTLCIDFGLVLDKLALPCEQELLQRYRNSLPLPLPAK